MTLLERTRARKPIGWLTIVGLVLLPVVIGGVLIAALHNPTERLENMTAAIVNDDDPVTIDGQLTPLGRQLAAGLVEGSDDLDSNLTWVLSNDEDAADGLADGTYQAVVTIPENFSKAALSPAQELAGDSDESAEQAMIDVETAPNALIIDDAITSQLADAAAGSMGSALSESTMSNLLVGFGTMGDQLGEAADGARQLADGADDAEDGADQLGDGADQLADGVGQLGDGVSQLADGAGSASTGAQELAGGARDLADGVPALTDGASGLSDGASGLADGIDQVKDGVTGDGGLASGAEQLADGVDQLAAGVNGDGTAQNPGLAEGASGLAQGVDGLSAGLNGDGSVENPGLANALTGLAANCATSGASGGFCDQLAQVAQGAAPLADGAKQSAAGAHDLADGTADLSAGLAPLAAGAHGLADGATQLGDNLPQLSDGAHQLATGASQLADGATQLGDGAGALASGASGLADGVGQLATGIGQAAANVPRLEDGATQVADGVADLGDGVGQLGDGAGDLADGLGTAVDSVPSLDEQEAESLASVIANPVAASSGSGMFGAASIPLLAVAVLWFGAMATFFALRAVSARALTSRRASAALAGGSLLPAAIVGAVQGGLVAGIAQIAAGYDLGAFWGLFGLSVLTGVSFAAIHQALVAVFGGAGRWIAGIVGAFAVAIGIVSTMPDAVLSVRPLLPTTPAFDGMLSVVSGTAGAGSAAVGLVVWSVLAFIATTIAVAARRTVSTKALLQTAPA